MKLLQLFVALKRLRSKNGLMEQFNLSEKQAQAILDMRLARLTGLEREKLKKNIKNFKC